MASKIESIYVKQIFVNGIVTTTNSNRDYVVCGIISTDTPVQKLEQASYVDTANSWRVILYDATSESPKTNHTQCHINNITKCIPSKQYRVNEDIGTDIVMNYIESYVSQSSNDDTSNSEIDKADNNDDQCSHDAAKSIEVDDVLNEESKSTAEIQQSKANNRKSASQSSSAKISKSQITAAASTYIDPVSRRTRSSKVKGI